MPMLHSGRRDKKFGRFNPTHHGTPEERVNSAETGFKLSYLQKKDINYAFEAGIDYVSRVA